MITELNKYKLEYLGDKYEKSKNRRKGCVKDAVGKVFYPETFF